jgi:hypothetical protein
MTDMDDERSDRVFRYLAYGSNLVVGGLARYVGPVADHSPGEHVTVPGWHLRFQGHSTRWDGSPATIAPDGAARLVGRAWSLGRDSLIAVVAGEAGVATHRAAFAVDAVIEGINEARAASPPGRALGTGEGFVGGAVDRLTVSGTHWSAPVTRPISQYDTVVAIDHADGALWAVTASVPDTLRRRCEPYLAQVHLGLTDLVGHEDATGEIEAALARSSRLPHTSA